MAKSLFPSEMLSSSGGELTLESVAAKLTYFHEQLHLLHWQTSSYAEHQALGGLYDYVHDFKDGVIEKLMGYMGKKPKAYKMEPLSDGANANMVVSDIINFAHQLMTWAEANRYCDVENLAQELSGEAAKTRYLLTLS
jgi:hypothetical protein